MGSSRSPKQDVDFDPDALFQRKSSTPTRSEYLEKLSRERAYLEGEITKLTGKTDARQGAIRVELQKALTESCAAMEAILKDDWFAALEIRDRMHTRLHGTRHFQWAPDLQRGSKFKRAKGSKNAKSQNVAAHVEMLVRANQTATREELYQLAHERKLIPTDMPRATFYRYVTTARRKLGIESQPGPRRK